MRPRKYINRVSVYQGVATADGVGGSTSVMSLLGDSWCNVKTLSVQRVTDLGLNENSLLIEVNLRDRSDIDYSITNTQLKYQNLFYNIIRVEPINLDGKEIKITAASNQL
tara:strand:+ start:2593 stop:2922 length:330 start_codon:yes stop_codon:yes gene_type:complete